MKAGNKGIKIKYSTKRGCSKKSFRQCWVVIIKAWCM